jgi:DegV family protein with EDD domain
MVKIITDTLSDIPLKLVESLGLTVVPLNLHFGDKVFKDRVDITTDEFYKRLTTKGDVYPTTSAPGPGIFVELFTKLSKETDSILCIMTSGKMSAIGESATQAKNMVKLPCRIEVVDTKLIAGALLLAVVEAAEAAKSGKDLDSVIEILKNAIPRIHIRMAFDTLEYLRRGGRIGKASALLGSLLKLQPVLGLKDGEVFPQGRARNRVQAVDMLLNFVASIPKIERMAVEHATTPGEADALVDKLSASFPKDKILRSVVSPVLGAHMGPHVLAVIVLEAKREAGDIPVAVGEKQGKLSLSPSAV